MTDVVLFHHAQGRTAGVESFAGRLRAAGHRVTVPDLYDGATFATLDEGMAHLRRLGPDTVLDRGRRAAADLPAEVVHAGFSLGVLPAQLLAQTRAGALGAVLMHACVPPAEFGDGWPPAVPLQIHVMEGDELGDVDEAREVAAGVPGAELHLYPGDRHLFTDDSLPAYDAEATDLVVGHVLRFLDALPR